MVHMLHIMLAMDAPAGYCPYIIVHLDRIFLLSPIFGSAQLIMNSFIPSGVGTFVNPSSNTWLSFMAEN